MTVIHIGDGRHIELDEGAAFRPPPPPPKPKRKHWNPDTALTQRTKRKAPKKRNPEFRGENNPVNRAIREKQGFREFWDYKNVIIGKYRRHGRKLGEGPGRGRQKFGYMMGHAKRKVKKDMANIDKKFPDLDPMAREALEGAVQVLREPNSQQTKLAAARLLLEFTKSKPVAKSDITVNAAEAWLASLDTDDT